MLKQLGRELQESKTLQLASVSPQLLQARGLELAVPGTYRADREVVAIASFAPTIKVMASKQRPISPRISPRSRLHLPHISPTSRLHLSCISLRLR